MSDGLRFRDEVSQVGFVQCSSLIVSDRRITDGAFRLYMLLLWYCRNKDYCFPGKERLANDLGVQLRQICKYLKVLKEVGLISVERRGGGKTNMYWLESVSRVYADDGRLKSETMEACGLERGVDENCGLDKIKKKRVLNKDIGYTEVKEPELEPESKVEEKSNIVFIIDSDEELQRRKEKAKELPVKTSNVASDRVAEIRKQREAQALLAGQDVAKAKVSNKKDLNVKDLERVWHEYFGAYYPDIPDVRWFENKQKLKMAKRLVTSYGGEKAKKLIVFMFENWDMLQASHPWITGMPTLQILAKMGDAWIGMALEGKKVVPPVMRKKNRGEYNEERAKKCPSVGWGKD